MDKLTGEAGKGDVDFSTSTACTCTPHASMRLGMLCEGIPGTFLFPAATERANEAWMDCAQRLLFAFIKHVQEHCPYGPRYDQSCRFGFRTEDRLPRRDAHDPCSQNL